MELLYIVKSIRAKDKFGINLARRDRCQDVQTLPEHTVPGRVLFLEHPIYRGRLVVDFCTAFSGFNLVELPQRGMITRYVPASNQSNRAIYSSEPSRCRPFRTAARWHPYRRPCREQSRSPGRNVLVPGHGWFRDRMPSERLTGYVGMHSIDLWRALLQRGNYKAASISIFSFSVSWPVWLAMVISNTVSSPRTSRRRA